MTEAVASTVLPTLTRHRFAVLMCVLLSLILLAPLFGPGPMAAVDVAILFSLVVFCFALTATRKALTFAVVLVWLALTLAQVFSHGLIALVGMDIALLVVCLLAIESTVRRALKPGVVGTEELCAAISAYVLMGIGWAAAYSVLQTLDPAALNISVGQATKHWNALLYFSFATLTTLGYGDLTPTSDFARSLTSVQAITGTIYLAILIAHLVGNFRELAPQKAEAGDGEMSTLNRALITRNHQTKEEGMRSGENRWTGN